VRAVLSGHDRILLYDSYRYKDYIKQLAGAKWNSLDKSWQISLTIDSVDILRALYCEMDEAVYAAYLKEKKRIQEAEKAKLATRVIESEPMPIKVKPYRHQTRGYEVACKLMGLFKD